MVSIKSVTRAKLTDDLCGYKLNVVDKRLRALSDRTQPLDATTDADDYIGRYARITGSQNSYNVFDRDLPGKADTKLGVADSRCLL